LDGMSAGPAAATSNAAIWATLPAVVEVPTDLPTAIATAVCRPMITPSSITETKPPLSASMAKPMTATLAATAVVETWPKEAVWFVAVKITTSPFAMAPEAAKVAILQSPIGIALSPFSNRGN